MVCSYQYRQYRQHWTYQQYPDIDRYYGVNIVSGTSKPDTISPLYIGTGFETMQIWLHHSDPNVFKDLVLISVGWIQTRDLFRSYTLNMVIFASFEFICSGYPYRTYGDKQWSSHYHQVYIPMNHLVYKKQLG